MRRLRLSHEELRTYIIGILLEMGVRKISNLTERLVELAISQDLLIPLPHATELPRLNPREEILDVHDQSRVMDVLWDLIIEGVLRPGSSEVGAYDFPYFHLTEWGKTHLVNAENNPYDPDKYLSKLIREIPNIDDVIVTYLNESLHTFRINCLLSSTITLGGAAEKAFLLLIDAYIEYLPAHRRQSFEDKIKGKMIKPKFMIMKDRLESEVRPLLSEEILEGMDVELNSLFDFIRNQRNDAGHPRGVVIERERAYSNLTVVPVFLKKVYELIDWFSLNQHLAALPAATPAPASPSGQVMT